MDGRVIVIAPTRASCETIELGVQLTGVETILEREHGAEIRTLAASGQGFGIVAGTGTGKTLAIRPIAQEVAGSDLRVGVVNREREATPETPTWNLVIVTTGIARRWLQDGLITGEDTVVVDEIHQTSAELELCLALGKRAGCRFIWLSATVDPTFYAEYLDSAEVIESSAFDPSKAARVQLSSSLNAHHFLNDRFLRHVVRERRGVAVFLPTRAETEAVAEAAAERWSGIHATHYHGGEPISKLRPFLDGSAPHPYLITMTAAGQSALNITGLDTVVISDARFDTVVQGGKSVLTRLPLGANEILQMAGRVHGRVENGEVFILTDRDLNFQALRPEAPLFQLAGDPERVALTCADVGVRADELDLPVPLDRTAYRRAVELLERRGLIEDDRLTRYGRQVEVLPVDRPWGELLIHSDDELLPVVAVCAAVESLYRMTRGGDREIRDLIVPGSDHLSAYNVYRAALRACGTLGRVWGLPRHVFDEEALAAWTEERGVSVRAVEDAALALASIYRGVERDLPGGLPALDKALIRGWRRLVARVMPFDLIIDGETAWGEEIQVSRDSVCRNWGPVAGSINYFSDRRGRVRGFIEGTDLAYDLVWEHAESGVESVVYDPAAPEAPMRVRTAREYHGFDLDVEERPAEGFPDGLEDAAREALAAAMAEGAARHPHARHVRGLLKRLREIYRRSGGTAGDRAGLRDALRQRLAGVESMEEFAATDLRIGIDTILPAGEVERWEGLPGSVEIRGKPVPLDYTIDEGEAVVHLRVPAQLVMRLRPHDVPDLDRPVRWTVLRGKKKAIRARSLEEAQEAVTRAGQRRKGGAGRPRRGGQKGGGRRGRGRGRR